jgi:hypothetical protein
VESSDSIFVYGQLRRERRGSHRRSTVVYDVRLWGGRVLALKHPPTSRNDVGGAVLCTADVNAPRPVGRLGGVRQTEMEKQEGMEYAS